MNSLYASRNNGLGLLMAAFLVAGLSGCGSQPSAEPTIGSGESHAPAVSHVTVPQGTEVHVTLSTAVGSETSQVGDSLAATTTAPVVVGDRIAIPSGSTILGQVTDVLPGTKGLKVSEKGGAVVLSFDKVTTPSGISAPINASLTSIADSTGKTAGIIGGSAAGGAILGKILGGSSKDAALGAVLGGGIGTGIAAGTKGKELRIPAGTDLTITLDEALKIANRT